MSATTIITISPELPCCALIAVQRRCVSPATVAQATRLADGSYHMQPFCWFCHQRVTGQEKAHDE